MEELRPARRSNGVDYDSLHSGASLRDHGAPPAGRHDNTTTTATGTATQEQPPFYKKKWFIITSIIGALLGIALLFILLFPVVRAIVQTIVNKSTLDVQRAIITQPQNNSFALNLQGNVAHTGKIPATIEFTEPVQVYWVEDGGKESHIGIMPLSPLYSKNSRADVNQNTTFQITDDDTFSRFSGFLITSPSFQWRLQSKNLKAHALKFPVAKGISFDKTVEIKGFGSFNGNVILENLELPSDNANGGIDFNTTTVLTNPSPFSISLGTVVFNLSYDNMPLGTGTSTNTVINPGNNSIVLSGVLKPHADATELQKVSQLFTSYLNGESSPVIAKGVSTLQSDGTSISWLSSGLQQLSLTVPFKAQGPISPIQTINIGNLRLGFDENHAWNPLANSDSVNAAIKLPFGFNVAIGHIENQFNIVRNNSLVAGLSTPLGASTSKIAVLSPTDTEGSINISIKDTRLSCPDPQHTAFSSFNADLTSMESVDFSLVGQSRAIANTSLGQITLDPIKVNIPTTLKGLGGLKGQTVITGVDVTGGSQAAIKLLVDVSIENPSSLDLSTGNLSLQLARDSVPIGTALLSNFTLLRGNNSFHATSDFDANSSPQGLQTLNDFVAQKDVNITISGYDGSTRVASLLESFKALDIAVTLPGLNTSLLQTASLEILPTTGKENNISHVSVSLANPFSSPLQITKITSTVKSYGLTLGTIDSTTAFKSTPKSTTESPSLDLNMNFDPSVLFALTRALAVDAGLNPGPLDGIVKLGGINYASTSSGPTPRSVESRQNRQLFEGFNLPNFVDTAFKKLQSDVELTTELLIGDYKTTLQYTQPGVPTKTDDSLNLILPVLAQPIVQKIVSSSSLGIESVLIQDPKQNSFNTVLKGSITNAGPFDATISFPSGLTVSWGGKSLGRIAMKDVQITGDVGGSINADSIFEVADVSHLTDFTKVLLTEGSFDWEISGDNLTVSALGISVPGISLSSKKVTLKGFNGLQGGVKIKTFDLPSNDPAGGIHLTLDTSTTNPSQVGIQLSSIGFNTFVGGVMIAPVESDGQVTLAPQSTSDLPLVGRLVPQTTQEGLAAVSDVFNNFIYGKDSNVEVQGASAGSSDVTWLNDGIKSLKISTILPNRGKQTIIKSIDLKQLELDFTQQTAYNPASSSKATDAAFTLPFGFPIDISAVEQTITLGFQGNSFAQLAIPKGPSQTDVQNRVIHLSFNNIPLQVFDNAHTNFNDFVAATTVGKTETLHLSGSANADAKTAVGTLSLKGIDFAVDSSIDGLQGLNTRSVTVSDLDVNHGYPDYLLIKANSALFNPSNLTIGTGDVSFSLQFQGQTIGAAVINDLVIVPGDKAYSINVHYAPQGSATNAGRALLQSYLQGVNVDTTIAGTTGSTPIQALQKALSEIRLSPVTIPALNKTLIQSASLVFPIDIVQTGVAQTSFTLANPFTASLNLLKLGATVTYHGVLVGKINNIDTSSNPIHANGHSSVTSPTLPLQYNLDPLAIIQLLTIASQENHVDLGPLAQLFQFIAQNPDYKPPVKTTVDTKAPTCVSGKQFDAAGAILKTLANLQVDLAVDSSVKIDDFPTDLAFDQKSVPSTTDKTSLYLIGAVAGPVTQHLVDGAVLKFNEANITNISDGGFDLSLAGSLTNVGPLDALIAFTEDVSVNWSGQDIARITLPPICAAANDGVPDYRTKARLTITNQGAFTSFATSLLHEESFEWTISTSKLRVTALGTIFDNISLKKTVSFKAFNNLPGVTISNFQLPSDDPAGGIHIETDALIPSPAQLGIDLGTVTFQSYFNATHIGPLQGNNLFLAPVSQTRSHLSGRIEPQDGYDLENLGVLFSHFLAGDNQTLVAKGDTVQPSGSSGPVSWLSTAFKTLSLEVTLPGQKYDIIQSIALNDLAVTMQNADQAFAPPTSSEFTLAKYKNPFGFSLQVIAAGEDIKLNSNGVDIAELVIPKTVANGGVSTGNVADLQISFHDIPLKSLNNAAFAQLFAGVTLTDNLEVGLRGSADVTARTKAGDVPLSGIPFDVTSSLKGINSFGHSTQLSNVSVAGSGGGGQYISSPLTTTLNNPSNVTLNTVDISLPVLYKDVKIGRAVVNPFNLKPGINNELTEFRYMPDNANDTVAQQFLADFIQSNNQLPLTIRGDGQSSPFPSLAGGLAQLVIATQLQALNQPTFITHINVYITLDSLATNLVSIDFDIQNPLDAPLIIEFVQSDSGVGGVTYAQFDQSFSGFVVPPRGTANSGQFGNVLLTQGALASLDIIPLGKLDVSARSTARVGEGGYEIPWLPLEQKDVPTHYELVLALSSMKQKAEQIHSGPTSSAASSSTASASASEASPATSTSTEVAPAGSTPSQDASSSKAPPEATLTNKAESLSTDSPVPKPTLTSAA